MRRDVRFASRDLECAGWLYLPTQVASGAGVEGAGQPAPAKVPGIVMAHGFSAVKEQYLDKYAEVFCAAGFAVLVFDYRFLGASPGEPRQQIFPAEQHEDYRNAITWLGLQPEVDPDRIGAWGSSYSGGHVLYLSCLDPRIKAAVAQVPAIDNYATVISLMGREGVAMFQAMITDDRISRYQSGEVSYFPATGAPGEPALMADDAAKAFFLDSAATIAPNWRNQVSFESIEKFLEYNPTGLIQYSSPTAVMMIVAEGDSLIPADMARDAFARAGEPKKLITLECGHFDVYDTEPWFTRSSGAAVAWFTEHLG